MKTVIEMALEAGFVEYELEDYTPSGYDIRYERFAELVRAAAIAAAREACAELVDHILKEGGGTWGDAIRARSNT